jgi:hypothetical protein
MARGGVLASLVFCVLAASAACGDERGSVTLVWRSDAEEISIDAERREAPVFQTLVYVRNESGSTLRDARLRFRPDATRNAPAGFRVGTVTPFSSSFEGDDQFWRVGDLEPGQRVAVPLGLWFQMDVQARQDHPVELILALISPDLDQAVESNSLRVRLNSP